MADHGPAVATLLRGVAVDTSPIAKLTTGDGDERDVHRVAEL
jgi:hypothetical protein